MPSKVHSLLLVALFSCSGESALAQMTIPEAVERMRPGPYVAPGRIRELHARPFEQAVRDADLIVHASLRKLTTYLSDDETELHTDHEIIPIAYVAGKVPSTQAKPGVSQRLVLTEWGGETTINGVAVKIYEENVPLLPNGVPLLLFLSFNQETGKYEVLGTITGAFEVEPDGRVRHLVGRNIGGYERINGAPLARLIPEIQAVRSIEGQ